MTREKNVKYDIQPLDGELPPRPTRNSQLEDNLAVIAAEHPNKWAMIAAYRAGSAATAAANTLRKRHGNPDGEGWEFKTRRVNVEGEERTGLFVNYNPERIVPGAIEQHREHVAKLKEEKKNRDLERAQAAVGNDKAKAKAKA